MSGCDHTCSAMAEWRSERLGRVRFTSRAEPAIDKVQPARDWSDLGSRLRELVRLSSEVSSELTIDPHVTLAHDPHNPLALLGQVNRGNAVSPIGRPSSTKSPTASKSLAAAVAAESADEPSQPNEGATRSICGRSSHPFHPNNPDYSLQGNIMTNRFRTKLSSHQGDRTGFA
jgi:hypothetical protein